MHQHFLRKCFDLAKLGETYAFPNPIVGCVIVHNNQIIGEGFHRRYGEAHAEVNAISHSPQELLSQSTIYVSLEPCAHHGKTPPCADLIIKHKFKRLVFSSYDPNPLVSGQGLKRIRAAGIEVIEPKDLDQELVKESDWLNRVFLKALRHREEGETRRGDLIGAAMWLTLKIAATASGSMISEEKWITNSASRQDVHRLRSTHQLLVTSVQTVRADNPLYTVRHNPEDLKLADIKDPDIVILKSNTDFTDTEMQSLNVFQHHNRKVFEYKCDKNDPQSLAKFITAMKERGYCRIMIEAGPTLSEAFINSGLVDEIIYYLSADNILSLDTTKIPFLNENFALTKSEVLAASGVEEVCNIKLVYGR